MVHRCVTNVFVFDAAVQDGFRKGSVCFARVHGWAIKQTIYNAMVRDENGQL